MACQMLHYSIFLYFYRILLHYYCIFWDLYLISDHFYSICFVSILYPIICIQYIRLFLLYNFRLYCIFSHLHCIFLDLYLIFGHFYSILLHWFCFGLRLIQAPNKPAGYHSGSGTCRAKTISYLDISSHFSSGSSRTIFRVTSSHLL